MPTEIKHAITEALSWRYATKQFDPAKKISAGDWQVVEEALQLSPSSFGLQPYKFVIVTDEKIKQELVAACYNQAQVAQCSHFVVFARNTEITLQSVKEYIELMAKVRELPLETFKYLHEMMNGYIAGSTTEKLADWAGRQTYIALGNLMTVAAELRIDNCPMEGLVPAEVDRILGLKDKGCSSVVACALGYRAADDKYANLAKVRFPKEDLFIKI